MAYKFKPGENRLPVLYTPEDIDAVDFMSEDEKELAKENLTKVPLTDPWRMIGCNPDMQAFWQIWEREMTDMMKGDMQIRPFGFMWFTNIILSKDLKHPYYMGMKSGNAARGIMDNGLGYEGILKLQVIDLPDSEIWSKEERLCIKFIRGCAFYTMTDEIFQEALDSWGESMVVLRMSWVVFVRGFLMMENAMGMKWNPKRDIFPEGSCTEKGVDRIVKNLEGTHLQVRELWRNLETFNEDPMKDHNNRFGYVQDGSGGKQ